MPTIIEVFIMFFLLGDVVPMERDKEKASILSPIPTKKYIRLFILSPYIFYSNILLIISFINDL